MREEVRRVCKTCRYWELKSEGNLEKSGLCRVKPPKIILWQQNQGERVVKTMWPRTKESDWCGSYEAHFKYREIEGKRWREG